MNLHGILPPIATPFTENGDLDLPALTFNVERLMRTPLRGVVALGSNGEAAYVTDEEAERVIAEIRPHIPDDRFLIAGAGRDSTRATIAAVTRAARAGADLVLVRVPAAFKGQMTADALEHHYVAVADQSPVPVLLYDFPQGFGVSLPMGVLLKLAGHPNIVGLKESSGDLSQIAEQAARTPRDFVLVVGSAPTLYASLLVGAAGGVVAVANVIPELCVQLVDLVDAGRHADALALQRAIAPLAHAVTGGHGVPALKAAMTVAGYRGGSPRAPLPTAAPALVDDLARMFSALAPASTV